MNRWAIVDVRTDERITVSTYATQYDAWRQINEWIERHQRGGRPDITHDKLMHMIPRRIT